MNGKVRRQLGAEQARVARRLEPVQGGCAPRLVGREMGATSIRYEFNERTRATSCGGIGAMHILAQKVGLASALDARLPILKMRRPYSESDHILNIAYDALCGGQVLETSSFVVMTRPSSFGSSSRRRSSSGLRASMPTAPS